MRFRRSLTLASALFATIAVNAEAGDKIRPLAGYTVTSWTDVDGRPFGAVYAIAQDADRYLWIATNAGLLRFDGVRFSTWEAIGTPPLPKTPASSLYICSDGSLWAGFANGGGVFRVAGRRASPQDPTHQLSGSVTALAEDANHTMWAVADSVLHRLTGLRWETVPLTDPSSGPLRVTSVARGHSGGVLVTTTLGLFRGDGSRAPFRKLAPGWAWAVDQDVHGDLWVTDTVTGFRRVGEERLPRAGFGRNGYRLAHDRYDDLWLASIGEGLLRISANRSRPPTIERATLQTGLLTDSVQSLFEDREGNLWAGTTVGLHRLTRQKLTSMPNVGLVTTAAATGDGDIWAGTNYGLVRFSLANGAWQPRRLQGPTVYVTGLLREPDGTLWIGAREGLLRLTHDRFAFVRLPATFGAAAVRSLAADGHGGLWIGDGQNLFRWDNSRLTKFGRPTAGDSRVSFAYGDQSGRVWMSFHDGSVGMLEEDGAFRDFPWAQFGSSGVVIHSIVEDANRRAIWFGTSEGISRLKDGRVATLAASRLPSRPVWTIAQNADGTLWAGLDWGVVRFSADEFQQAVEAQRPFRFDFYDPADGLSGAPLSNMRSGRTTDGTIWFVRGGALTTADPATLDQFQQDSPGPIRIEAATNEGAIFDAATPMTLPAALRRLDINYTAVALTHPNRIRFRYHLDGFDTHWTDAGTRRSVSYTNLPPREYTFRVEAETNAGAWSASAPWSFSISPTPYQTWWFDVACALVAGLCAWGAWRFRLRLERQRYAILLTERARLSREIHDTLLQGMVGMTLQLEHMAQDTAVATDLRAKILGVRRQLAYYIRDARRSIKNLRSPILETHDLTHALREIGARSTADTAVSLTVTSVGQARRYTAHIENELLRIAQEAITNAMRHSHATRINVTIGFEEDHVTLEVVDNGRGLGADSAHRKDAHFGIVGMSERAERLGGRFNIGDPGHGGTRVTADIPTPAQ